MRRPAQWFGALRRRQRSVLWALLPALVLSASSGPACAAMLQDTASDTTVENHDTHAAHRDSAAPVDEPAAPATTCPHCPLESGTANVDHTSCVTVDAQEDSGTAPPNVPGVPAPAVFVVNWLLPAARASPPLIAIAHDIPLAVAVPLNLRHCVLLI